MTRAQRPVANVSVTDPVSYLMPCIADARAREILARRWRCRIRLTATPTPLHLLPNFSERLGREVWIKRDDLTGFAAGGNKSRKLELILADAMNARATSLVTVGAQQSNHARTVAAAATAAGIDAHLVLGGSAPEHSSGNLLLDNLFGAEAHFVDSLDWDAMTEHAHQLCARLQDQGKRNKRPYFVPAGGSTSLGVLSYAAAFLELHHQLDLAGQADATIVVASSTGGTQAGLELGAALLGVPANIVGVDVAQIHSDLGGRVRDLVAATAVDLGFEIPSVDPTVFTDYLGPGYALASNRSQEAMTELARDEGIVTDPVYTAKAVAALKDPRLTGPLVFLHTGGVPAMFAEEAAATYPAVRQSRKRPLAAAQNKY
ncbi:pyridoxal-phosphate dependent enzyme [Rhodococcus sp. USK10]|uniref:1-aminocyclopropane-1-carboxylate deaminase/D-cysteine desulfhydrase n=1 Tax=Rhodococcus sp. USK10 TaxID=2789739 RepID=UPI001C5DE4C2|nr:pyridoxal-phosphate dependent enzyme [Rhodococcus sp. USK10]QYB01860.1 pyridoxal-phosphate dependent enzyme [Rhodococcus sp. USK10]